MIASWDWSWEVIAMRQGSMAKKTNVGPQADLAVFSPRCRCMPDFDAVDNATGKSRPLLSLSKKESYAIFSCLSIQRSGL